jgi:hypothetical protein
MRISSEAHSDDGRLLANEDVVIDVAAATRALRLGAAAASQRLHRRQAAHRVSSASNTLSLRRIRCG